MRTDTNPCFHKGAETWAKGKGFDKPFAGLRRTLPNICAVALLRSFVGHAGPWHPRVLTVGERDWPWRLRRAAGRNRRLLNSNPATVMSTACSVMPQLFVGSKAHHPKAQALWRQVQQLWPQVRTSEPWVVGSSDADYLPIQQALGPSCTVRAVNGKGCLRISKTYNDMLRQT